MEMEEWEGGVFFCPEIFVLQSVGSKFEERGEGRARMSALSCCYVMT